MKQLIEIISLKSVLYAIWIYFLRIWNRVNNELELVPDDVMLGNNKA